MLIIDFIKAAKNINENIIDWRRDLHRIPELGLDTPKTREYIEDELKKNEC